MSFKGCIMVKKTRLLDALDDTAFIFRSKVSKNSKWHVLGQKLILEGLLEGEYNQPGLREYAAFNWYDPAQHFGVFWSIINGGGRTHE